jgi:ABC-type nitrate/sulfonate/bicarbonate transport system permease component
MSLETSDRPTATEPARAPSPAGSRVPASTPDPAPAGRGARTTCLRRAGGLAIAAAAAGFILLLLVLQEILTRSGVLPADYFPPASEILGALVGEVTTGDFWSALASTATTWLLALVISVVGGSLLGLLIGAVPPLEAFLHPIIEFLRPVPSVALIPLVVLTIGTQSSAALTLAVFAAFWQVLVPAIAGARSVHPITADTARAFSLSRAQRVRYIQLPSMLPYLATATRLAAATALILVVTAEIIIGIHGLGQEIALSRSASNPARMYAYIAVTGVVGIAVNALVRRAERALGAHGSEGR